MDKTHFSCRTGGVRERSRLSGIMPVGNLNHDWMSLTATENEIPAGIARRVSVVYDDCTPLEVHRLPKSPRALDSPKFFAIYIVKYFRIIKSSISVYLKGANRRIGRNVGFVQSAGETHRMVSDKCFTTRANIRIPVSNLRGTQGDAKGRSVATLNAFPRCDRRSCISSRTPGCFSQWW